MNDGTMRRDVAPKFGDKLLNTVAGDSNPRKIGIFVRVIHRAHGRMNPGKWWQMTDGKGDFWESNPDNLVPFDDTSAQASAPEGGETVPYCKKCGDGIVASDPGICGACYDTDHVAAPEGEPVAWQFRLASDKDGEWQSCKPFVFEVMRDQPEDYEVRELYTRSNAKAGEVDAFTADEVAALANFAAEIMRDWPDVGGFDGFDLQQMAEKQGLLFPEERTERCGDVCQCADDCGEWPVTCYRYTSALKRATALATQRGDEPTHDKTKA